MHPVVVVDQHRTTVAVEIEEPAHLLFDSSYVVIESILGEQDAFIALTAWGRPPFPLHTTHQRNRLVASQLKSPEHHQRQQRPDMQRVGGWVKAGIQRGRCNRVLWSPIPNRYIDASSPATAGR